VGSQLYALAALFPGQELQYHFNRKLGGHRIRMLTFLIPCPFRESNRHYTDWATPVRNFQCTKRYATSVAEKCRAYVDGESLLTSTI